MLPIDKEVVSEIYFSGDKLGLYHETMLTTEEISDDSLVLFGIILVWEITPTEPIGITVPFQKAINLN